MTAFSLLDIVPVAEGGTVAQAIANAADLAVHAERLGFKRYWVAEHHGMSGIASAATSVVLAHVASKTRAIRIGAGGIMLPNHAPLAIAEQFGTLDALFPGRIDLGLGRAPGSDQRVAQALRRGLHSDPNGFPQDVLELRSLFADDGQTGIQATPGANADIALWILGSSTYGAQVAAALGLPYAFASHFAPDAMIGALEIYRRNFRASAALEKPYVMGAFNVFAADTQAEAELIFSSQQQAVAALRTGRPGKTPPPLAGYYANLEPVARSMLDHVLKYTAVGTAAKIQSDIAAFVDLTGVDELIFSCITYDHDARKRSFEIAASVMRDMAVAA